MNYDPTKCFNCGKVLEGIITPVMDKGCSGCVTINYCSECLLKHKVETLERENETLRKEAQVYAGFKHGEFYDLHIKGKSYLYVDRNTEIIFNWPGGVDDKGSPCVGIGTALMMGDESAEVRTINI